MLAVYRQIINIKSSLSPISTKAISRTKVRKIPSVLCFVFL